MKSLITFIVAFIACASIHAQQPVGIGDLELRVKTAEGMVLHGMTPINGRVIGFVNGAPGLISLTSGPINLATGVTGTLPEANGGTGITSLGTGVATLLGTFNKANLDAAISDDNAAYLASDNTFSGATVMASGTVTDSAPPLLITQAWNDAGETFQGVRCTFTNTSNSNGEYFGVYGGVLGTTPVFVVSHSGGNPEVAVSSIYDPAVRWSLGRFENGLAMMDTWRLMFSSTGGYYGVKNLIIGQDGAGVQQNGDDHATTATAQTIKAHDVTTGTGAKLTIAGGKGTSAGGAVAIATSATNAAPVDRLVVTAAGLMVFTSPAAPSSASDTGTANEIRWDANYIYICTATNTWKRVAIATW